MKYIKLFEDLEEPQIGDFVMCQHKNIRDSYDAKENKLVVDKIGKIMEIYNTSMFLTAMVLYRVHYKDNIKGSKFFNREDIIEFAKTVEELKLKMEARKYNL